MQIQARKIMHFGLSVYAKQDKRIRTQSRESRGVLNAFQSGFPPFTCDATSAIELDRPLTGPAGRKGKYKNYFWYSYTYALAH